MRTLTTLQLSAAASKSFRGLRVSVKGITIIDHNNGKNGDHHNDRGYQYYTGNESLLALGYDSGKPLGKAAL